MRRGVEIGEGEDPEGAADEHEETGHRDRRGQADTDPGQAEEGDGQLWRPLAESAHELLSGEGPDQGARPHGSEQQAECRGVATQGLGVTREHRLHHRRGDGEYRDQGEEAGEHRGEPGVSDPETDHTPQGPGLALRRTQMGGDDDQADDDEAVGKGVDPESDRGADGHHQSAPDGRADCSRHVERRGLKSHGRGDHLPRDQVGEQCLPRGQVERHAHPEDQAEAEQHTRGDEVEEGEDRHQQGGPAHDHVRQDDQLGAVEHVREGPRSQGEEEQGEGGGGDHQPDPGVGGGELEHQP